MNTSCKCNETKINDQGSLSKRLAIYRLEIYPVDSVNKWERKDNVTK